MQRYRPDIAWPLTGKPWPIMAEDSDAGEYYAKAEVDAEIERLRHRCNALAYLHYGHYLVQRDRQNVQADIEACEGALTALRAELRGLDQHPSGD